MPPSAAPLRLAQAPSEPIDRRWFSRWSWQQLAVAALAVVLLVEGYIAVFRRDNDFLFHRHLGLAFLQGEPYGNAGQWYPVGRVMLNAGLAALDYRLSRGVSYGLALLALWGSWCLWRRLAQGRQPLEWSVEVSVGLVTCGLMLPYLVRDLDECGLQLFLLFFLSAGAWAVMQGKNLQGGCWLALAATYKLTPLLCLPFLVWKRRFAAAAWMGLFLVGWNLIPAVFVGWDKTVECHEQWLACMRDSAKVVDPAENAVEQAKPHNLSLAGTVGRYLETYPPGHPLYLDHPAFVQFGRLSPLAAKRSYQALVLVLGLILAWQFRHAWRLPNLKQEKLQAKVQSVGYPAAEWAVVCMLCALLSPVCWKQHLMVGLPCAFLAVRSAWMTQPKALGRWGLLCVVGLIAYGARHGMVGQQFSIVLLSYKLDTLSMLLLVIQTLVPCPAFTESKAFTNADEDKPSTPALAA